MSYNKYTCECNVAANFPSLQRLGFISVSLRANTQILITTDGVVLTGASVGELSITAYGAYAGFTCPGRAGVNYEWIQKYDCEHDIMYFIPKGGDRSYYEGEVSDDISMTTAVSYETFSASAASGPHTPYLKFPHFDGYDFNYSGRPIQVTGRWTGAGAVEYILPGGSEVYLTSFTWEQTPPSWPTVSYSFIASLTGGEL